MSRPMDSPAIEIRLLERCERPLLTEYDRLLKHNDDGRGA
jgi:hypothetical protein